MEDKLEELEDVARTAEPSLRKKVIHTVFFLLTYFIFGIIRGQEGVVFLDLIIITNADIASGSFMFTSNAIGYIIGVLLIGTLFDKFNNDMLYCACVLMTGVTTLVIPWCKSLPLMIAIFGIRTFFMGPADSGSSVICAKTWLHQAGPFLQLQMFLFSVGGIISPFITEPFLLEQGKDDLNKSLGELASRGRDNQSTIRYSENTQGSFGFTQTIDTVTVTAENQSRTNTDLIYSGAPSQVYIAFVISGCLLLCVALTLALKIALYGSGDFDRFKLKAGDIGANKDVTARPNPIASFPKLQKGLCYGTIALNCFAYACIEKILMSFIMTLSVEYLGWSKKNGSLATTVFWAGYAGGRFLGIFLIKILKPRTLLFLDFFGLLVTFVTMFLVDRLGWTDVTWWALLCMSGLFLSSVFATNISWLDTTLTRVTDKLLSFMFVWNFIGMMTHMALLGYLFEHFTPMWFVYLLIIHVCLLLITQATLCIFARRFKRLYYSSDVIVYPANLESEKDNKTEVHKEAARLIQPGEVNI